MRTVNTTVVFFSVVSVLLATGMGVFGQSPYESSDDLARYAMKLRENALLKIQPQVFSPTTSHPSFVGLGRRYRWKVDIVTTVFWVGERSSVPNTRSAWDTNWVASYGGVDTPDPVERRNFIPIKFTPRQNPFYCALPYNDVIHGATKPEAPMVIPWFKGVFQKSGESVCRNRWLEIRNHFGQACYAQWSDCGLLRTDRWEYVFGNDRPSGKTSHDAGLGVSPAVRDFLNLNGTDVTSWRFVDFEDVPPGPWSYYGENNDFVINARRNTERVISRTGTDSGVPAVISRPSPGMPAIITR